MILLIDVVTYLQTLRSVIKTLEFLYFPNNSHQYAKTLKTIIKHKSLIIWFLQNWNLDKKCLNPENTKQKRHLVFEI